MESLSETTWDVVLCGTGLHQSLLALALSRSGKKVLHIDKNDYYGGAEAALSLQEVETWAEDVNRGTKSSPFRNITIKNAEEKNKISPGHATPKLGFSRAYSLLLSPQIIYTRSNLLPALVSSKVYRQLEFLAVGSWWLYRSDEDADVGYNDARAKETPPSKGNLRKIPGGREDVFADQSIDRRSMMSLMKFLKLAADPEAHTSILDEWGQRPFPDFLQSQFKISPSLQEPLLALTLSPDAPTNTLTSHALPNIHRHLTSIGMFGPGFGAVIPKWGGLAEIAQVGCRAGAVGGGVYVLKKSFETHQVADGKVREKEAIRYDQATQLSIASLEGGDDVKCRWIIGSQWDLPSRFDEKPRVGAVSHYVARSITIISGAMSQLFPPQAEGAPPPAGAIVVVPIRALHYGDKDKTEVPANDSSPVYLMIHSSDTGECPIGQCIIYGHTFHDASTEAHAILEDAVQRLLKSIDEDPLPVVLWSVHYEQQHFPSPSIDEWQSTHPSDGSSNEHIIQLPDLAPGLALEDDVLKNVKAAYSKIMRDDGVGFMTFEDREGMGDENEEGM